MHKHWWGNWRSSWKWGAPLVLLIGVTAVLLGHAGGQHATSEVYADGQFRMEIATTELIAQPMKETTFIVTITELPEEPVTNAKVQVQILMPDMFCGVFPAKIVEISPGVYSATAVAVMPGTWQAEARVELGEGLTTTIAQATARFIVR